MTRTYVIDSFTASDGSFVCGAPVDHPAWLKGTGNGETVHMLVQFSSRGVSAKEADDIVRKIATALSQ